MYLIYVCKEDLALNNQQWLIYHKIKPNVTNITPLPDILSTFTCGFKWQMLAISRRLIKTEIITTQEKKITRNINFRFDLIYISLFVLFCFFTYSTKFFFSRSLYKMEAIFSDSEHFNSIDSLIIVCCYPSKMTVMLILTNWLKVFWFISTEGWAV